MSATLPSLDELHAASAVVYTTMPPTPQYHWPLLAERLGADIWVKHENHAPTGAFKVRGGLVYMSALCHGRAVPGVVAATRGNHGQSVAFAALQYRVPVTLVVPRGNSVEKNAAMRALGAELVEEGEDFQESSEIADAIATRTGWHRLPSFHPLLVRGVATYAHELLSVVPLLDTLYVPIGMGSGACGAIAARDALGVRTEIVGVVSASAPAYALSLAAGNVVPHAATTRIADGLACRTPDPSALAMLSAGLARVVQVTDDEVEAAMRLMFSATHNAAEGAGAAALAGLVQERAAMRGRRVAVVLSGGNVDANVFARVLGT
ncbi:MAG: threonine dehydratase [Gemmatimonadaceae bacterium]